MSQNQVFRATWSHGILLQELLTEAKVCGERALARAMQGHLVPARLEEWGGQIVSVGDAQWYGGVELSPVNRSTAPTVSMDVQELQPGVEYTRVRFSCGIRMTDYVS